MLHLMAALSILCACAAPQGTAAETAVIKGELKDVPAQGKTGPLILCEGATNLPDGALINVYLYYDHVREGREIGKDTTPVKGGKFSHDLQPFLKKNLAGKYIAR